MTSGETSSEADLVLEYASRTIAWTRSDIETELGRPAARRMIDLLARGDIVAVSKGVFTTRNVPHDHPCVVAILDRLQGRPYPSSSEKPAPPSYSLSHWIGPARADGIAPPERIYVEAPGYPSFYAQRPRTTDDDTPIWSSMSDGVTREQARAYAEAMIRPLPPTFEALLSLIPNGRRAERPVPPDVLNDPAPVSVEVRHPLPCVYVVKDTVRLDPSALRHPLPEATTVIASDREPEIMLGLLSGVPKLVIERRADVAFEYAVPGRMIASRLDSQTFAAEISGSASVLIERATAMAETGLHRILLIEGGPYAERHHSLNRLTSSLSYLQNIHGIHICPTMNSRHSAYTLVQAIKHHLFGMQSNIIPPDPADQIGSPHDHEAVMRLMLRQIPGISDRRASEICARYRSIAALCAADAGDLERTPGIGRSLAKTIRSSLGAAVS